MAVHVEIYESRIVAHFTPGGEVYRNGSGLGRRAQDAAREIVGKRSHRLEEGTTHGVRPNFPKRFHVNVNLQAKARSPQGVDYAPFVEGGTVGPIRPTIAKTMPIPPHGRFSGFRAKEVSGQRAQRFLERGMNRALNSLGYGSIP